MSYTPTNWQSGDIVTAAKLNKIESGIANAGGGGVFIINISQEQVIDPEDPENFWYSYRGDKTAQEIEAAYNNGYVIIANTHGVELQVDGSPADTYALPNFMLMDAWQSAETGGYDWGFPIFYYERVDTDSLTVAQAWMSLTPSQDGNEWHMYVNPLTSEG